VTVTPTVGDTRIRDLEAAVARLSARVDSLESAQYAVEARQGTFPIGPRGSSVLEPSHDPETTLPAGAPAWLGLLGRTCIVLGGAFSLRALTNTGQIPTDAGVWLGLAYAVLWLVLAARASGPSTFFHGVSSLLVALPLIAEAVLGFKVMSGEVGALVMVSFAAASLGVASHRRQHALAMTTGIGTLATAIALMIGLSQPVAQATILAPVVALISIGTVTLWVAYRRDWTWLPWPVAAGADLGVLIVAFRASAVPPREAPLAGQLVNALLIACYLGSFVARIVLQSREVRVFEVAQTAIALAVGLGGAVAIAHANHVSAILLAFPPLLVGGLLYVQTFTLVARRGAGPAFYWAGMTALALVLVGLTWLFGESTRPVVMAIGALAASLAAWRLGHPLLALQGAIAAIVAALQSGLVAFTTIVWLTHGHVGPVGLSLGFVLVAVLAALVMPRAVHEQEPPVLTSIARVALSLALVAGTGSLLVIALGSELGPFANDIGAMATLKTVILAGAAAGLAWAGRSPRFVEFGWIAYGALGAGGLKILFEDLPNSRPATLFIALAAYGAALISVQKLRRG
jgi:hypothetical protein